MSDQIRCMSPTRLPAFFFFLIRAPPGMREYVLHTGNIRGKPEVSLHPSWSPTALRGWVYTAQRVQDVRSVGRRSFKNNNIYDEYKANEDTDNR